MTEQEDLTEFLAAEYPSAPSEVLAVAAWHIRKGQEGAALQLLAPWKPKPEGDA